MIKKINVLEKFENNLEWKIDEESNSLEEKVRKIDEMSK